MTTTKNISKIKLFTKSLQYAMKLTLSLSILLKKSSKVRIYCIHLIIAGHYTFVYQILKYYLEVKVTIQVLTLDEASLQYVY